MLSCKQQSLNPSLHDSLFMEVDGYEHHDTDAIIMYPFSCPLLQPWTKYLRKTLIFM